MSVKSLVRLRDIWALPPGVLLGKLAYRLKTPLLRLALPTDALFGSVANVLASTPPDPWPGQADRGAGIIQKRFELGNQVILDPSPLWFPPDAGRPYLEALHGFCWLRDLRASGGDQARRRARELTGDWIAHYGKWDAWSWEPALIGLRLASWLGQYEFFAASANLEFRQALIESVHRQAHHLARILPAGLYGAKMISTVKGLIFAGIALPGGEALREKGLKLLERELAREIRPDGGHIERSPGTQLSVLRDLMDIRAGLSAADATNPSFLEAHITAMAPVLRLLQHGDGKLALFNGTNEGDSLHIDLVLQRSPGPKRPLMSAPDSGFQRLQAARSVAIVDTGVPPPAGYDLEAHAGTGSFEFSVGRERIIVNCGAQAGTEDLRLAQRSTAAHSTLVLAERNSTPLKKGGGFGERSEKIFSRRVEDETGNCLLEMSFEGYYGRLGALHHRSLYLSASGDDLRGEDRLEYPEGGGAGQTFAIRFHLHPDVKTLITHGSTAVFISTKKAGGWRLRSMGAKLALEPSIYLGEPGNIRRSQQVVLYGEVMGSQALVKWALQREQKG